MENIRLSSDISADERQMILTQLDEQVRMPYGLESKGVEDTLSIAKANAEHPDEVEAVREQWFHLDRQWHQWTESPFFAEQTQCDEEGFEYDRLYLAHLLDDAGLFSCYFKTADADNVLPLIMQITQGIVKEKESYKRKSPAFLNLPIFEAKHYMTEKRKRKLQK